MVTDIIAEALESAGFYRRAARRWLEVFDQRKSTTERDWIRQRRNRCLLQMEKPTRNDVSLRDVGKAATEAQRRMGIAPSFSQALRKSK
ncbi:PerC family transcriptional regulator [Erwinia sp. JH02]|uniref:PerC family transcriptional regulator n=1 Tax=Erwinia sp. JH02 TaxID=2733394 RepID=UPI001487A87D|nr:PerC family transcriptional regulator [Erwinia sp. JH02]NNS06686.1 PerC family transcriptional regulator [Erwinia sp. JH02]